MVVANFLLDDKSPLLRYDSDFLSLPGNDNLSAWYYLGTYTVTATNGASMEWAFNGSGFTIWGVMSYNHGDYSVQVDNGSPTTLSGTTPSPVFQQPLVESTLPQGTHTVSLTNLGTGTTNALDVDMVTFQSNIEGTDQLVASIIQDTDDRFKWSSGWDTSPASVSFFSNGSGHVTTSASATFNLSFTGVAVSLYGSVGPNNGPYQVQLDGVMVINPQSFSGTSWDTFTQVMLYHANDIGDGPHELTLYNLPSGPQSTLAIDYAEIFSSTNEACSSRSSSSTSTTQKGLIGGLVVACTLAAIAILSALWLLRSNRRLRNFHSLSTMATQGPDSRRGPFFRTDSVHSGHGPYIPASAAVAPSTVATSGANPSSFTHDTPVTSSQGVETSQISASDSRRRALPRPTTVASITNNRTEAPPAYQ